MLQNLRVDLHVAKRPNALTNIVDQKTPQIKTQRIRPDPSDMVQTSIDCCNKLKERKKTKEIETIHKSSKPPKRSPGDQL